MEPQIEYALFRLRTIRADFLVWTLEETADLMHVSKKFLGNMERLYREPKISTILKYCDVLEITIDTLFYGCPTSDGRCRVPNKRYLIPDHDVVGLTEDQARIMLDIHPLLEEYYWLCLCLINSHPHYIDVCKEFLQRSLVILPGPGCTTTMSVSYPEYKQWDINRRAK